FDRNIKPSLCQGAGGLKDLAILLLHLVQIPSQEQKQKDGVDGQHPHTKAPEQTDDQYNDKIDANDLQYQTVCTIPEIQMEERLILLFYRPLCFPEYA